MSESKNNVLLVIRPARVEDVEVIAKYNMAIAKETEDKTLDGETLLGGVRAVLGNAGYGRYYMACVGDEVVGQLMLTFEWSDWRNGMFWWIQSVYVRADFRRQGVFRALYDYVRDEAKGEEGVCGLRLYVEEENERAQQTYRDMGMTGTGYEVFEEDWS